MWIFIGFCGIIQCVFERMWRTMKVQCLNSSARKTRNLIKKSFAELLNEKRELDRITVTELVKRADITRSTFYTHYDNIYQVAQEYQLQTIELLCNEELILHSKEDILDYFDNIFSCLKENEELYKLLLNADVAVLFLEKLKNIASKKILEALKSSYDNKYLELDISFLMDGITVQILKYFRNEGKYSLDELLFNLKKMFKKIFD